ncbi:MAG: ParB N-terminal domain-containing protein [Prevotella sp.]|nr:ParB N-terminal domain-containing protein [Prevotella sp.]
MGGNEGVKPLKIRELDINELVEYEDNPRENAQAVEPVAESIKQFGFKVPIVIDKDNVIITGHTRLRAAKMLGMERVPTIQADDLTEDQVKAFRLADNKTAELADWDMTKLANELSVIFDIDMTALGFEDNEFSDVYADDFGEDFELPNGEQNPIRTMTFTLHREQKELIEYAMQLVENDIIETYGNEHKKGNALYEVVRQWAEQKRLS